MKRIITLFILGVLFGCSKSTENQGVTQYVDPFIGTGGHGHTYPGASMPNGMVQLSPDTRMEGWDACSGYHYTDNTIIGFSHTHLSGTGIGDYGDILIMPTVNTNAIDRGEENNTSTGYRSKFSHKNEVASPGYYSVLLEDYDVLAELTATTRAGFHRYTFPESDNAAIILDLSHTLQFHRNTLLSMHVVSDTEIEGIKKTSGWAKDHTVCFYAKFSKPFTLESYVNGELVEADDDTLTGDDVKARLSFATKKGEQVLVKVGISAVDTEGAKKNLEAELTDWDFDKVSKQANNVWEKELSGIEITTDDKDARTIFYTSLYHTMLSPNTYVDVDGRYRGQDLKIHTMENGEQYYTVFSLWDTFRALHPLMTLIKPELNSKFVNTLVKKYQEGGQLPMWDLASNYTGTMIGYHSVSVIVEAYLKGITDFDPELAFEACVEASRYRDYKVGFSDNGLNTGELKPIGLFYKNTLGYIPSDLDNESVAKALEYSYNDWCIAQFAKALGKEEEYKEFSEKGLYYKKYFDPETRFMRGILKDGSWNVPFDPAASNHRKDDYCEGNAWQWSWYAPHDVEGLVELYGGNDGFVNKLDSLFTVSSELVGDAVSSDISGLIGQYAHGNEPSHHITHLYNYVGQSWKTQELVDHILYDLYFNDPNGLAGNEDCGQISAWYILNAVGLYSIAPANGEFTFGRPIFDNVVMRLGDSGKKLVITTKNNSRTNKYIQSISIDGEPYNSAIIPYSKLMSGINIEIEMGDTPNKEFGV